MTINVNGETFITKGKTTIDKGWKAISGADTSDRTDDDQIPMQNLSNNKKGDKIKVNKVNMTQGMTKPPARYTEGTLLGAMENPSKFVESKELKDSIKKGGLGTPATRADIIEKLFSNYYIERDENISTKTLLDNNS